MALDQINTERNTQDSYTGGADFTNTLKLLGIGTETETETPTEKPTESPVESPIEDGENPAETEIPAETQSENSAETPSENSAETPSEEPTEQSGEIPAETETPTENETQQNPENEKTVEENFNGFFDKIMDTDPKYLSFFGDDADYTLGVTNGDEPGEQCIIFEMKDHSENSTTQWRLIKGKDGSFRKDEITHNDDSDDRETVYSKDNLTNEEIKQEMRNPERFFAMVVPRNEWRDARETYKKGLEKTTEETTEELNELFKEIETEIPTENETQQDIEKEITEEKFNALFDGIMNTHPKYLSYSDSDTDYTIMVTNGDEPGEQCIIYEEKDHSKKSTAQWRLIKGKDGSFREDVITHNDDSDDRETVNLKDNLTDEEIKHEMREYERRFTKVKFQNGFYSK